MSDKTVNVQVGGGFTGLLTILFIALKITGYITWSWWWVFAPLWIPWSIFICVIFFGAIITTLIK